MLPKNLIYIFFLLLWLANSCTVSFINAGIDYSVLKSFSIEQFEVKAQNAPPNSGQTFSELLKDRVLNNTRLAYQDSKGDVDFRGYISNYTVKALAPQADQTVAFQRLTINIQVDYRNTKVEDGSKNWSQSFSRFANFSSEEDLASVEETLIQDIYAQILDDVFNRAFSGW